jgi:hypothetical protein
LTKYIIPSVLPPYGSQNLIEINSDFIEKYVGNYELKLYDEQFKVGEQNGKLYIQKPGDPKIILHPETENTFYGNYEKIGKILVSFFQDTLNQSKIMVIRIGFLSVYLEKTN